MDSDRQVVIEGSVENVIFHNAENGYCVFSVADDALELIDEDEEIVCVGYVPNINEGETIRLSGVVVMHPSYGKQIQVQTYEKTIPKTEKGIEKYLASGVIRGIGPSIARRIIEAFGAKTLDVMEREPEKLSSIKGISKEKAMQIGEIFHEQAELRRAMLFLQDYGISPVYAMKIYKRYKDNTIKVVQNNPYTLAEDIIGIGFKIADNIAENIGIEKNSPFRIKAGIKYVLNQASANGHVYLPQESLIKNTATLLAIDGEFIENTLAKLQIERQIWVEKTTDGNIVFLNSFNYAETYVAKKLLDLSFAYGNNGSYEKDIDLIEQEEGIKLAPDQRKAVNEAMNCGVLVITGGPGTGKTTTINTIIKLLQKEKMEIELAAPTGRAAKRMTETTGIEAQTIHRLLNVSYMAEDSKRQSFDKDEENPIEADVVIIDESSMVDIILMSHLLNAIAIGTRLILVGDADQLPSVGAGNVLKDIINSECIKVVKLNQIFRQAQESAIIMNAHRINKGEYPVLNEKNNDFFFMKRYNQAELINTVTELALTRLPKFLNSTDNRDIQILTPMRKSPLGVINLNNVLQSKLNPPSRDKREKEFRGTIFREGDKVMQIKNNYDMVWKSFDGRRWDEGVGVFNGDEGTISHINEGSEYIVVDFDDNKTVRYDYSQLDELELSYAVTIHKSQGSEYRAVIIPVFNGPEMLLSRNLLYTAVTRAKELAVIVGIPETLYRMVDNNREVNRYTYLKTRIQRLYEFMKD